MRMMRAQQSAPFSGIAPDVRAHLQIGAVALPARGAFSDGTALIPGGIVYCPHVDLAEPRRDCPHSRLSTGVQVFAPLAQALVDLLPGEVDVDMIAKHGGHLREAVAGDGARVLETGDPR